MVAPLNAAESKPMEGGPSFPLRHRLYRALWNVTWFLLASWTPPFMHPWRCLLLRLFGAKLDLPCDVRGRAHVWYPENLRMGKRALIADGVDCYNMAPISLGERALVSQRAFLCAGTHDADDPNFQLLARSIHIGAGAWIAAEAFVGPGVTVGEGAVLGARGVAFRNLEARVIYVGNPAHVLRKRSSAKSWSE